MATNFCRIDRHTQEVERVQYDGKGYYDIVTETAAILL